MANVNGVFNFPDAKPIKLKIYKGDQPMKTIFALLSLMLITCVAQASTFTVCSSTCNYTTIASAYNAASCGDTVQVNINGGINETLILSKKCSVGSPIRIVAGTGYTPKIDITATTWADGAVRISGNYHIWDGIDIYDIPHGNGIYISGSNNTIQNCDFDRISYNDWPSGQNASAIIIRSSSNIVQNCTFGDTDHEGIQLDGIGYTTKYNQILNNTISNSYGHGVSLLGSGAQYNLIDGNDISDCGSLCVGSGCSSKNAFQVSGASNNSFRRNIIHNIFNRAIELSSYSAVTDKTSGNYFYNNTFYDITTRASDTDTVCWVVVGTAVSTHSVTNNKFYNNIADKIAQRTHTGLWNNRIGFALYYATENDAGDSLTALRTSNWNGNFLVNNIIRPYYNSAYQLDSTNAIYYTNSGGSYHSGWDVGSVNELGSMSGNITSDPLFTSTNTATPNWWHIQSASPAIDSGVVVIDPNAAAGGWTQLSYEGSAPDIGAFEFDNGSPIVNVPTNLRIIE